MGLGFRDLAISCEDFTTDMSNFFWSLNLIRLYSSYEHVTQKGGYNLTLSCGHGILKKNTIHMTLDK